MNHIIITDLIYGTSFQRQFILNEGDAFFHLQQGLELHNFWFLKKNMYLKTAHHEVGQNQNKRGLKKIREKLAKIG